MLTGKRAARFRLVEAAHRLCVSAVPVRRPETIAATLAFAESVSTVSALVPAQVAVVCSRIITVLSRVDAFGTLLQRCASHPAYHDAPLDVLTNAIVGITPIGGSQDPVIRHAVDTISRRYADPHLTLQAAAAHVGLTTTRFARQFTRETGRTWHQYRRDVRLDRAAALLRNKDLSIKECWAAVGYGDASNFNHDFTEQFGMSPTHYRGTLPDRATRPAPPVATHPDGVASARVLLVEDDQVTRETEALWLRLEGYAVECAATGREAIAAASNAQFDGILLDFNLPDMTGLECLRHLRGLASAASTPVTIFTADWDVQDLSADIRRLQAHLRWKVCDMEDIERIITQMRSAVSAYRCGEQ
jgi:AraC-like DNA-binding protein/CheY-like chemotaxis protein